MREHGKIYGYIYYKIYRLIMLITHKYHWHHMKPIYPDNDIIYRCNWCGMCDAKKHKVDKLIKEKLGGLN